MTAGRINIIGNNMRVIRGSDPYYRRVLNIFGASIIAYWTLWDQSGTIATDISGNGLNGTYQGAYTLAGATAKTGKSCVLFTGAGDVNVQSVLTGTFTPNDFTILFLMNNTNYESAGDEYIVQFTGDANNFLSIYKQGSGIIKFALKTAGAAPTPSYYDQGMSSTNSHILLGAKFKFGSEFGLFLNGCKFNIFTTGALPPAQWAAVGLTTARIGALNGSYSSGWKGGLSDFIVMNRAITDAEMMAAYKLLVYPQIITIIGDSISSRYMVNWTSLLQAQYNSQNVGISNHAVGGHTIIANMDAQVVAAASDNADVIIIHMGTSDDDAGDMGILQAEVEENIAELKISNPNATIYYMNVLPCWTDAIGGPEIPKGNIRIAIAAACLAQGITCWDTYNVPWIIQAQTSDGIHPTAAGHAAIATEVLARL